MLSDHRPVSASFTVDVEEFSSRKLQRALTLTDAEVEDREIGIYHGISMIRSGEVSIVPYYQAILCPNLCGDFWSIITLTLS